MHHEYFLDSIMTSIPPEQAFDFKDCGRFICNTTPCEAKAHENGHVVNRKTTNVVPAFTPSQFSDAQGLNYNKGIDLDEEI